ncbi:MAG: hypothetical protein ACQEVA_22035 [Myxococcota bacterium]
MFRRFWTQPSTHYRNFQLVFALLFVNFAIPATFYVFAPEVALGQFSELDVMLGGAGWTLDGPGHPFWRFLGAANVLTLAFMCFWLMRDLRNNKPVLVPLVFLKGMATVLWLGGFALEPAHPVMLAAGIFDGLTCVAFVVFATLAFEEILGLTDPELVPRPAGRSAMGWMNFEQRWAESVLAAAFPASPDGGLPGVEQADFDSFWHRFAGDVPMHFKMGLRAATWVVTLWPMLSFRSLRTFHGLDADRKDEVLRALDGSGSFILRQVGFVLKTAASFAYFSDPALRAGFPSAYPQRADATSSLEDSGDHPAESDA